MSVAGLIHLSQRNVRSGLCYDQGRLVVLNRSKRLLCTVFEDGKSAILDDFCATTVYGGGKNIRRKQAEVFVEEIRAFLDVCRQGGAWSISWENIIGAHRACFDAMCSLETG